jgi:hypothetical protein
MISTPGNDPARIKKIRQWKELPKLIAQPAQESTERSTGQRRILRIQANSEAVHSMAQIFYLREKLKYK